MRRLVCLLALLSGALAGPARPCWAAVRDSLREVEPWQRRSWLAERGLRDYYRANSWEPRDDSGLVCVGRWSYGPSVKVSLRVTEDDTVACLARGSGASIIRFRSRDSLTLELLSDIDCSGIVSRAIILDTLVFCGMNQGGTGIEVWGVSDLAEPHRLSYTYLPPIMDIAVQDTFLYATGYVADSLRVFNVADPRNPVPVGACADSGISMCVAGEHCYLADQYGVNIVDVSDPSAPHRVGSIGGFEALSVAVRDSLLYIGTVIDYVFTFRIYNVRNPVSPLPVGTLADVEASDIYLPPTCDTVLYTPKLHVINIADPAHPRQVGFVDCPGWDYGVTAVPALNYALVADYFEGLVAVDLTLPAAPRIDTMLFAGDMVEDICLDGDKAYLASHHAGMQILDVAEPNRPRLLGACDTSGRTRTSSVVARDSFAYMTWLYVPFFRSVDIGDPRQPRVAGGLDVPNYPEDMVLVDSLCYVAENRRFQVVNVARPREPELVGSCDLPFDSWKVLLRDTLAFVANVTSLQVINIARPDSPGAIGTWGGRTLGIDLRDTLAFTASSYYGCVAVSLADPRAPYTVDSLPLDGWMADVVVIDTLAYVGGTLLYVVDVSDPDNLRVVGTWRPPQTIRRLVWKPPYLYAACYEGGVCILESLPTGVQEAAPGVCALGLRLSPSVTTGLVELMLPEQAGRGTVEVYDAVGCRVAAMSLAGSSSSGRVSLDLGSVRAGVYVVSIKAGGSRYTTKVVKTGRR